MLCIFWNQKGILHWELLPRDETVDRHVYSEQLKRLAAAIQEKEPDRHHQVLFLHDNARPHIAKKVKQTLEELGWEVLKHPPYSPDLAPSDFHLFLALDNAIRGLTFSDEEELENWLAEWFASKPAKFFKEGMDKLPERWQEVIKNNGDYIID